MTRYFSLIILLALSACSPSFWAWAAEPPKPNQKPFLEGTVSALQAPAGAPTTAATGNSPTSEAPLPGKKPLRTSGRSTEATEQARAAEQTNPSTPLQPGRKPRGELKAAQVQAVTVPKSPVKTAATNSAPPKVPTWARTDNPGQCYDRLRQMGVKFKPVPDVKGPMGCGVRNAVSITEMAGARVVPAAKVNCALAQRLALWASDAQTVAAEVMADRITTIHHMSAYSCRKRGSGKLSEHGYGNAFDLGAVSLANAGRTTVLKHWYSDQSNQGAQLSRLWKRLGARGCERFQLVLSPVSNAAHKNHLHFDAGRWANCEI